MKPHHFDPMSLNPDRPDHLISVWTKTGLIAKMIKLEDAHQLVANGTHFVTDRRSVMELGHYGHSDHCELSDHEIESIRSTTEPV